MEVLLKRGNYNTMNINKELKTINYGGSIEEISMLLSNTNDIHRKKIIESAIKIKLTRLVFSMLKAEPSKHIVLDEAISKILINIGFDYKNNQYISMTENEIYYILKNELICLALSISLDSNTEFNEYLNSIEEDIIYISKVATL